MAGLGKELIDLYEKHRLRALIGLDDWADRLSYFYTTIVLIVCFGIVSTKTYFTNPLVCHVPTTPGGSNFKDYLAQSCWTQGTIPLRINESTPQTPDQWAEFNSLRRTNYYYWIPFMLGLQTLMFYLPDVVWRSITFNRLGANLTSLIEEANAARGCTNVGARMKLTASVAESMKLILFAHRDVRSGFIADFKRQLGSVCGYLLASKRLGTWTVFSYLCIKCLYLANAIGQLHLMRKFLNFGDSMANFGIELTKRMSLRDDWKDSLYFPRTAVCQIHLRLVGVSKSSYTALCALPINLFNEKIYIFLWFWVLFVAVCTAVSIPMWIAKLSFKGNRLKRMRRYFQNEKIAYDDTHGLANRHMKDCCSKKDLQEFIDTFLRYDGIFILDIIGSHCGDIVCGEIVRLLWLSWTREFAERHDFRHDHWDNHPESDSGTVSTRDVDQASNLYPTIDITDNNTLKTRPPSSIKSAIL